MTAMITMNYQILKTLVLPLHKILRPSGTQKKKKWGYFQPIPRRS